MKKEDKERLNHIIDVLERQTQSMYEEGRKSEAMVCDAIKTLIESEFWEDLK